MLDADTIELLRKSFGNYPTLGSWNDDQTLKGPIPKGGGGIVAKVVEALPWCKLRRLWDRIKPALRDKPHLWECGTLNLNEAGEEGETLVALCKEFLDELDRLWDAAAAEGAHGSLQYLTLDQAAGLVNRSARTLEGYLQSGDMPRPDVEGGGRGKAHEWQYDRLRPWLERTFDRPLPERLPSRSLRPD